MHSRLARRGPVAVLAPSGHLDGRAAARFEQDVLELLHDGSRFVIVDCAGVSLLAGAGLRVLLLLARSLEAGNGRLVLCGVNGALTNVLKVAGLAGQFATATSVEEAMAQMPASVDATVTASLAVRVGRLLERRAARTTPTVPPTPVTPELHALATRVMCLLSSSR